MQRIPPFCFLALYQEEYGVLSHKLSSLPQDKLSSSPKATSFFLESSCSIMSAFDSSNFLFFNDPGSSLSQSLRGVTYRMPRMCVIRPLGFLADLVRLQMRSPTDLSFVAGVMLRVSMVWWFELTQLNWKNQIQRNGNECAAVCSWAEQMTDLV